MRHTLAGVAAALVLLAGGTVVGLRIDRRHREIRDEGREMVYLPPAWLARYGSLGHAPVIADYFWLQALQYYGNEANRQHRYRDLYRYISLVIELDPDFRYAYRFGAVAVPYNTGNWTWHNVQHSNEIIEAGVTRFPDDWKLWLQLGFNRGVLGTDFVGAAEAYRRAAAAPGSPRWIPALVTRLYASGGALERAKAYADEVLRNSEEPEMQEAMRQRQLEIQIEESLRTIDAAIARFRERTGDAPTAIEMLVPEELPALPEDPLGGTFYIEGGEAKSSSLTGGRLRVYGTEALEKGE